MKIEDIDVVTGSEVLLRILEILLGVGVEI
jgi:hypothetical protein